ncbi:MAG: alpha/beta fold hydrolase, partial [Proteobacteria bacterium]|nr:alpha/beta fold hydrolase [Pseudomonadota bacterium]
INSFAHYKTEIDGMPIHFIREPGKGPNPIPIILTHGWPWVFWDYHQVIRQLADPASYGGDPADAFEVIVPSLPGFGFSTPLTQPGINFWRTADLWYELMTKQLGFEKFAAQGGDWGALVTTQLGHKYTDSIIGIHLTSVVPLTLFSHERPWDITAGTMAPSDLTGDAKEKFLAGQRRIASHVAVQVLDPQTLSYGLHDSPVGLLAWLVERRRNWGDTGGDVESRFSKDHLLTTTMLYWLTNSFVTSARYYAEAAHSPWTPSHDRTPLVEAPTGITYLGGDIGEGIRSGTDDMFNLHYMNENPSGGHFAPAEEPDVVIKDIRATFRGLR